MFASVSNSQKSSIFEITLLRHGQSQGNYEGRYQGQTDYPLTELGRDQAHALGRAWQQAGERFDLVISSPLKRAYETAGIVAGHLDAAIETDPDWMERHNGLLAGLTPEQAAETHPRPGFLSPFDAIGSSGESQWALYLRAGRALDSLLKRPPGRYLVVSHGGILNMALYAILGLAPQANFQGARFRFGNSAYARMSYRPESHIWDLTSFNDHSHLAALHSAPQTDSPLA